MAPTPPSAMVFYDGTCGMCHGAVRFIVHRDSEGRFGFAPLAGRTIERYLGAAAIEALPDSLVVITDGGEILLRARAVRYVATRLGGPWGLIARVGGILPDAIADRLYDGVAAVRHRFFGRRTEACPVVPAHVRGRFFD